MQWLKKEEPASGGALALKGGGYSLAVTALVLAIIVAVNLLFGALPARLTNFDISSSKLYSITGNTRSVVSALDKDVTLYWIVQADAEDDVIENLLSKYEGLSSHIEVVKKNPDVYPTFAAQYTDSTVLNNSVIVVCGDKYRYVDYYDIYLTEYDSYSYTYTVSGFDGEGAITSAINYVVSDELPTLYTLTGHGEQELPSTFADTLAKENVQTAELNLMTENAVPDDADCVMIYAPQSDISDIEAQLLLDYAENGGSLLVMAGPVEDAQLTTLNGMLSGYGVTMTEGFAVESDSGYYAYGYPYLLVPEMESHSITDPLLEEGYLVLLPLAQGMTVTGSSATPLLTTSSTAYSKTAGFALTTWDKEEGDTDGPFTLAVHIAAGEGQIVWFSVDGFLDDQYNAYASGANVDLTMNALASLLDQPEAMTIRSRSFNYNYLTISDSTASTIKTLLIGVFPAVYLAVGIVVVLRKRGKQRETTE